jgi:hypothetical protein
VKPVEEKPAYNGEITKQVLGELRAIEDNITEFVLYTNCDVDLITLVNLLKYCY